MINELGDLAVVGMGSFAVGALVGRKLAMEAAKAFHALEGRLAALEHRGQAAHPMDAAPYGELHASAMMRLAGAIEKHAAAIDDHGAATVAAAVESNAKPSSSVEPKQA